MDERIEALMQRQQAPRFAAEGISDKLVVAMHEHLVEMKQFKLSPVASMTPLISPRLGRASVEFERAFAEDRALRSIVSEIQSQHAIAVEELGRLKKQHEVALNRMQLLEAQRIHAERGRREHVRESQLAKVARHADVKGRAAVAQPRNKLTALEIADLSELCGERKQEQDVARRFAEIEDMFTRGVGRLYR